MRVYFLTLLRIWPITLSSILKICILITRLMSGRKFVSTCELIRGLPFDTTLFTTQSLRAMHTRHRILGTLALFLGLLLTFVSLSPTSAFAQRTSEENKTPEETTVGDSRTAVLGEATTKSQHTPATTIENSGGDVILQTSDGGSLLAPSLGGAIPAEGAGGRMMWYANKRAFRAGEAGAFSDGENVWDDENVGALSVAFGGDTEASGDRSVAMGASTTATNLQSTAMGQLTTASGQAATAMGRNTEASGFNATTMGRQTVASGDEAVAMGEETQATGNDAVAAGFKSRAGDARSVAMGFDVVTDNANSAVFGQCNTGDLVGGDDVLEIGNGPITDGECESGNFSNALRLERSGNMTIAGTLTENSDRRLKTDIEPFGKDVLKSLQEIRPVRFQFKDERTHPSGQQIGLIAQEVQKEFPELVSEGDDGMLSLSYTKFSAVLLKGLQEQQTTIDQQEERIATLEAENEEIKERLAALEAEETTPAAAGLMGSWGLALLLGLGGLAGGVLWRRRL